MVNNQYVLVFLIKGDAKKYHLTLTKKLSQKFGIENVSSRISPHITLKFFKEINNQSHLKELKLFLKRFSSSESSFDLKLTGTNHFTNKVIFIDVEKSRQLMSFYDRLYSGLKTMGWIYLNSSFEGENVHFHATLATEDISPRFNQICSFISKRNPQYFLRLNKITLMKKIGKEWKSYKTFNLN
jgi:2'-5' RNA ligase